MLKLAKTTASSLALLLALVSGSAHGQDKTFDVEASDPVIAATLADKEAELEEFFEDNQRGAITPETPQIDADLDIRAESELMDRASREAVEFNDIDDDDLSELTPAPRMDRPGVAEKDIPIDCPVGTAAGSDGTCLAGPDWVFAD